MRKTLTLIVLALGCFALSAQAVTEQTGRIPIKVLIIPKFEIGEMGGDKAGEAQFYYENYLKGGDEYQIQIGAGSETLYVKDGVALFITGMGKVGTAINLMALMYDQRFDFSDAYVLSTGCGGGAAGYSVMGDVVLCTAAVDYDLGHHADIREMENEDAATWFHVSEFEEKAFVILNQDLMDKVYDLIKDIPMETTGETKAFMASAFDNAEWAIRDPMVIKGTAATGDNYWKGEHNHRNAVLIAETYNCPDPFAITEMEDVSVALVMRTMGMQDKLIIIRGNVNLDVFMNGATPEYLWDETSVYVLVTEDSEESVGIFDISMENTFKVGRVIIDAILDGTLR